MIKSILLIQSFCYTVDLSESFCYLSCPQLSDLILFVTSACERCQTDRSTQESDMWGPEAGVLLQALLFHTMMISLNTVAPGSSKWHQVSALHPFNGWIVLLCVPPLHFVYAFIHWLTLTLILYLGCWEQCSHKQGCRLLANKLIFLSLDMYL